jgi:hypothetical protein
MSSALTDDRPHAGDISERRDGGLAGMVWLTWRQHRWALICAFVLTVLFAGWMVYLSVHVMTLYEQCGASRCSRSTPAGAALWSDFGPIRQTETLALAVRYLPLLLGVFIGVPLLAREHEQRTLLLAWSQDVSPVRWLWSKLALLGLYVAVLSAALSLASANLAHVYATVAHTSLFVDLNFLNTGLLPLVNGVCWFAVGVALGAVIKHTLPAIFTVVAGYRVAGQCSVLQGGGEGPRWEGRQGPSSALCRVVLLLDVLTHDTERCPVHRAREVRPRPELVGPIVVPDQVGNRWRIRRDETS